MKRIVKKLSLITSIFAAGMLILGSCDKKPAAEKTGAVDVETSKDQVVNITSYDHFKSVLDGSPGKLLVFDLYADWCKPCRLLAPTYSALAQTHGKNARFYRVDIQQHRDIASAFQANGIPLVVFVKDNEVVKAIVGLNQREIYEQVLTVCGPSVPAAECKASLAENL
jgi:thioredoxin 1